MTSHAVLSHLHVPAAGAEEAEEQSRRDGGRRQHAQPPHLPNALHATMALLQIHSDTLHSVAGRYLLLLLLFLLFWLLIGRDPSRGSAQGV